MPIHRFKNLDDYDIPENCDFSEHGYNDTNEYRCSPKLDFFTTFTGILVNGPKNVVWPKGLSLSDYDIDRYDIFSNDSHCPFKLRIAGVSRTPDPTGYKGEVAYKVRVVAVNQNTGTAYCGTMDFFGEAYYPPGFEYEPERVEQVNFNIDLIHNLGIPIANATYTVFATLGEYKSNVLSIKTSVR